MGLGAVEADIVVDFTRVLTSSCHGTTVQSFSFGDDGLP